MRTSTLKHFTPNYTQYDYTRPQTPGDSFNPLFQAILYLMT